MVKIYVEGGGGKDNPSLKIQCRRAFSELIQKAGFKNRMPAITAWGGREAAFDAFKTAHADATCDTFIMLLVDSETVTENNEAWTHLKTQAGWERPKGARDDQAQMMVVCMETWLMADPEAMAAYFGRDFKKSKIPTKNLENRSKADVYAAIAAATAGTKPKGKYGKARDSFELLRRIDPAKLRKQCSWADRFFGALETHC